MAMVQKCSYNEIRNELETGDMVFFSGNGLVSEAIKAATNCQWSHVGLVVRWDLMDLVLIWESTTLSNVLDISTGSPIRGVQAVPLSARTQSYDGYYGFRRMGIPSKFKAYETVLRNLRRQLNGKPYEKSLIQLLRSCYDFDRLSKETDLSSVFCSELVAEYYQRLGVLPADEPSWSYSPADLARYDFF